MAPPVRPALIQDVVSNTRGRKNGSGRKAVALKLRYPELSEGQIAKRVGCDPANVHRALNRFLSDATGESELRDFQEVKADAFDVLQLRIHKSITDEDIAKAPLLPRVTAAAILEDKARTIRGQATQVNVTVLLDAVQAIREMRASERNPRAISGETVD